MGFWYSEYATFTATANNWAEATDVLNKVGSVSIGKNEYAEGGVELGMEYNCYSNKAIIRFRLRSEGCSDGVIEEWFNHVCEIPEILNGLYSYRDDWTEETAEKIEYGTRERFEF